MESISAIRFSRRSVLVGAAAVTSVLAPAVGPASAQDAYYAGKEIEVVVPFAEGGATDVGARFLQPFLEQHIPGNPTVHVRNRAGGGSILGANWFEQNANPDGTTILFTTSSTSHPFMLGQQEVEYDLLNKPVGYSFSFGPVYYVAPETGIETPEGLRDAQVPLIYGGIAAAASHLPQLVAFEVLDLDVQVVLGFTGRGPIRLAFERGETNFDFQFTPVYLTQVVPLVEEGRAVPLMTGGAAGPDGQFTERDPVMPDLPSVYEVHEALYGEPPSGIAWDAYNRVAALTFQYGLTAFLHEDTPQEALDALNAAVEAINADPEFQEQSKDVTGGYMLIRGDEAEPQVRAALDPGEEVTNWLRELLATKYDVRF
jgi:hypothetical protein